MGHLTIWPWIVNTDYLPSEACVRLKMWKCLHCEKAQTLLERYEEGSVDDGREPVETTQVWPRIGPRELADDAPQDARSLYREASLAEGVGALRAAAALYRAATEAIVRDQVGDQGPLYDRIEKLDASQDLIQDLHEARLTGNWSLHDGLAFSPEEISDVADLIRDAANEIYVLPAARQAMREARASRREAAKARKSEG